MHSISAFRSFKSLKSHENRIVKLIYLCAEGIEKAYVQDLGVLSDFDICKRRGKLLTSHDKASGPSFLFYQLGILGMPDGSAKCNGQRLHRELCAQKDHIGNVFYHFLTNLNPLGQ